MVRVFSTKPLSQTTLGLSLLLLTLALTGGCDTSATQLRPARPAMGEPQPGGLTTYDNVPGIWRHGQGLAFFSGPGDPEDFLFRDDIDLLLASIAKSNTKTLYMQLVRSHGGDGPASHNPFIGHDPNLGVDQSKLEQWFQVLARLETLGVDVFLFIYDDSSSPWNSRVEVSAAERDFIKTLVERFKTLRNIVWVVAEEYSEAYEPQKVEAIAEIIFNNDEFRHPIAVHKLQGTRFDEFVGSPHISVFLAQLHPKSALELYQTGLELQANANGRYTPIMSEMNEWPKGAAARKLAWANAMSGVGVLAYDVDIVNTPIEDLVDLSRLQKWFESSNLRAFRPLPNNSPNLNQWVYGNPNRDQYLVYRQDTAPISELQLSDLPSGRFSLDWLNPASGKRLPQEVTGAATFTVPQAFAGLTEIALKIERLPSARNVYPGKQWQGLSAKDAGIQPKTLQSLVAEVGGNGCIARYGQLVECWGPAEARDDWGSATKPIIVSLIEMARTKGLLPHKHDPIEPVGWPLKEDDRYITWHQLINMTSGYGRAEAPGMAWAYNDHAVQLFAMSLERQLEQSLADIAQQWLRPLQLGPKPLFATRDGRGAAASAPEMARIGWWWRNRGQWADQQLIPAAAADSLMQAWVPHHLPRTAQAAPTYLELGSFGGGTDLVEDGPGYYGNSWWFNSPTAAGALSHKPLGLAWPDLPADTFLAIGHSGRELIAVIPSFELVVVWRDTEGWMFASSSLQRQENRINQLLRELLNGTQQVSE